MNAKLVKGGLAAGAAVLIAGGGATYAAFSDVETVPGNGVTAGVLDITSSEQGAIGVSSECPSGDPSAPPEAGPAGGELNPGCYTTGTYLVTNSGESTLDTPLYFRIASLTTSESGCSNGVPTAEQAGGSEYRAEVDLGLAPLCDVDATDDHGELDDYATFQHGVAPVSSPAECDGSGAVGDGQTVASAAQDEELFFTPSVAPGEMLCFTYRVGLGDDDLNDAAQGDSFDMTLEWTTYDPVDRTAG